MPYARRRQSSTAQHREIMDQEATTIHKLLGWTEEGPSFDADNTLPVRMVIVDEASMLDLQHPRQAAGRDLSAGTLRL